MKTYTKQTLIAALQEIRQRGWIKSARDGNDGDVGNTLEDLLGIEENNLPLPNAAEWELKCQRANSSALTTLMHLEPSPRAMRLVSRVLLPLYGWPHQQAGKKYPANEMSFRQTINAASPTSRGFCVVVNKRQRRVEVSFNAAAAKEHAGWLKTVERRVGLGQLAPQPYWGINDLFYCIANKLNNCFYVKAEAKREGGAKFYRYTEMLMLEKIGEGKILSAMQEGDLFVDFDARTGHNHGTKFRLRQNKLPALYERATKI